jgi:hypothetical protein
MEQDHDWDLADDEPDPSDDSTDDWWEHPSLTAEERNPSLCRS